MRVLIVEDEKQLAAGLKKGLEAEGFATDVASDGTDGLWMAREHGQAREDHHGSIRPMPLWGLRSTFML